MFKNYYTKSETYTKQEVNKIGELTIYSPIES